MSHPASPEPVLAYPLSGALYLNLTSACTLACTFCPKIRDDDWVVGGFDLKLARPPDADEVWRAVEAAGPLASWSEVVFTGLGEPTRRLPVLLDVARRLRAAGARRVRLDTDGLASLREGRDVVPELAAAGLQAVSVSLNAADPETYLSLCPNRFGAAAYDACKAFIRRCVEVGLDTAASAVAVPGLSEAACRAAVEGLGARFRFRPYDRLGRVESAVATR